MARPTGRRLVALVDLDLAIAEGCARRGRYRLARWRTVLWHKMLRALEAFADTPESRQLLQKLADGALLRARLD